MKFARGIVFEGCEMYGTVWKVVKCMEKGLESYGMHGNL